MSQATSCPLSPRGSSSLNLPAMNASKSPAADGHSTVDDTPVKFFDGSFLWVWIAVEL